MADSVVSETYATNVNNQATSSAYMHIPQNGCSEQSSAIFSQPSVSFTFIYGLFVFTCKC